MRILLDVGVWSWKAVASEHLYENPWEATDKMCEAGALFCFDSRTSLRKDKYPFYKAGRSDKSNSPMREKAHEWCRKALARYDCRAIVEGLEADDLLLYNIRPDDLTMTTDKDILQSTDAFLVGTDLVPWGIERMQRYTKLPLKRGRTFIAYQLIKGDATDNIPSLLPKFDRKLAREIMNSADPLMAAIMLFPEKDVRRNLELLLMPTPLYTSRDPIDQALGLKDGEGFSSI